MAFERSKISEKILGDNLEAFVSGKLNMFNTQMKVRNANDELNFSRLTLENNISLNDQLVYRQSQLSRASDDPDEKRRITAEISSLKDRIESQNFNDEYTSQLISHEQGVASNESLVSWLRSRLNTVTDQKIKSQLQKELITQESSLFAVRQSAIKDATQYAVNDKSSKILDDQIGRIKSSQSKALFDNNRDLAETYNLQLQALNQAKEQNDIEQELKNFAVGTLAGYHSAVGQLDAFNAKIMVSSPTTPVTIGGVRYNSSQEYWRFKRDSYVSDQSPNGMFARLSDEQKTALTTKLSSNTLTNADITATSTLFDSLIHRPELATYAASIMNAKQDVIQSATDAKAKQIYEKYATSLDAKKAVADLNALKALGGNVEGYYNKILLEESQGAFGQMSGIIQEARRLIDEEGLTMQQALDKAAATQVTLSPEDLLKKTPKELASESLGATKKKGAQADQGALLTPEGDPINDLSSKYGIVGKTVYDKATGKPFMNEQEFFTATGLTNFKGVTFDTSYKPPAQAPSATPSAQPVQPTEPQTPAAFDTVTATSDDYLAIANLAWVLSGSAKQQQAQYGSPDIGTLSGNRASYMKAAQDVAAGRTTGNRELDNAMNQAIQKYSQTKQPSPQAPTPAPTQPQAVVPQQKAPSPAQAPAKQQAAQQQSYTVASGDTLSAISKRLLGDANRYAEIAKLNKIADPNKINPGQKLIIPNK